MSHEALRDGNLHSALFILEESGQVQFNFLRSDLKMYSQDIFIN